MPRSVWPALVLAAVLSSGATVAETPAEEKTRYLRPAQNEYAFECEFAIRRTAEGWSINSLTDRGKTRLTVHATYDNADGLTAAEAALIMGDPMTAAKKAVGVKVAGGKATVQRDGLPAQAFDVPAGVIVTSAPDWTDTFLLCQRYDREKGGKQSFPGLWIHPVQDAQLVTFTIERLGADAIEHDGKKLDLTRFAIRLRGNSSYMAWADSKGRMVKLVSLPFKEKGGSELVLQGFQKSTTRLKPAAGDGP